MAQVHTVIKCACCSRLQLPLRMQVSTPLLQGRDTVHYIRDQFLLYSFILCAFLLFCMLLALLVFLGIIFFWWIFIFAFSQLMMFGVDEFVVILYWLFSFKVFGTQVTTIAIIMLFTHMQFHLLLFFHF